MTAHVGNLRLLDESLTALFCSNRCPGFQTPMEKECLRLPRGWKRPARNGLRSSTKVHARDL